MKLLPNVSQDLLLSTSLLTIVGFFSGQAQADIKESFQFKNGASVNFVYAEGDVPHFSIYYSPSKSGKEPGKILYNGSALRAFTTKNKNYSDHLRYISKNSRPFKERHYSSNVAWFWDSSGGHMIFSDGKIQKSCLNEPYPETTATRIHHLDYDFIIESFELSENKYIPLPEGSSLVQDSFIRQLPDGECSPFKEGKFLSLSEPNNLFQITSQQKSIGGTSKIEFQFFQGESFEADPNHVALSLPKTPLPPSVENQNLTIRVNEPARELIPSAPGRLESLTPPAKFSQARPSSTQAASQVNATSRYLDYKEDQYKLVTVGSTTYLVRKRDRAKLILSLRPFPAGVNVTESNAVIKDGILSFPGTVIKKKVDLDRFDAELRVFSKLSLPVSTLATSYAEAASAKASDQDSHSDNRPATIKIREQYKDLVEDAQDHPERYYQESDPELMSQIASGVWAGQSVALLGTAGTGKTSAVRAFARDVAQGKFKHIPRTLQIFQVDTSTLASGTTLVGMIEQRVKQLIWAAQETGCFYFFDEVHRLSGVGTHSHKSTDIIQDFKGPLEDGELRFLATSTTTEFYQTFETDPAIVERFKKIQVKAPAGDRLVHAIKNKILADFGKVIEEGVIQEAIQLSKDHAPMTAQPRAAINLLKAGISKKVELGDFEASFTQEDLRNAAMEVYMIPASYFKPTELQAQLVELREVLSEHFIGQSEAQTAIVKAWRNHLLGIKVADQVNTVLFAGPPGVGKTSMAEKSAEVMGVDKTIIRMNELDRMDPIEEFKRQVYMAVLKNPHQLIILDEIEKAPLSVQTAALSMLQSGEFTVIDKHPSGASITQEVNAKNILFMMTTNAAGNIIDLDGVRGEEVGKKIAYSSLTSALIADGMSEQLISRVTSLVGLMRPSKVEFKEALNRALTKLLQIEGKKRSVTFELARKQEVLKVMYSHYDKNTDYRQIRRILGFVVDAIAELSLTHRFEEGEVIELQVSIPEPVKPAGPETSIYL